MSKLGRSGRKGTVALLAVSAAALLVACVPPPEPPPDTTVGHVTVWQADVAHSDSAPEIVDWVGFGQFLYNVGMGGCNSGDGGEGFSETFERLDANTVRVTITLDWVEDVNFLGEYGCGVMPFLTVGLLDASADELLQTEIPLLSHT